MTASQALMTGLMSGPLAGAKDARPPASSRDDRSEPSFREALDSAARSRDTEAPRDKTSPRKAGSARDQDAADANDERDTKSEAKDEPKAPSEQGGATTLSLVLAALASSTAPAEDAPKFDAALVPESSDPGSAGLEGPAVPVLDADAGLPLPGQTDGSETLDTAQLIALLSPEVPTEAVAAATPNAAEGGVVSEISFKVTGQETHLAMAQSPAEQAGAIPETDAETPAALAAAAVQGSEAQTDVDAAPINGAQLPERSARARTGAQTEGNGPVPGVSKESAVPISGRGTQGGPAFGEQGIPGQDGQQHEGRGGANSNSSSSAAFASAMQGVGVQTSGAARGPAESAVAYEPPSEQIAAQVSAELRADGLGESSSDGVLKVLHLELKPANLGSVTVRLSLKDNVINLHIEAQSRDTLALIERERQALTSALASVGYQVDGVTVAQSDSTRLGGAPQRIGDAGPAAQPGQFQGQGAQGQGLANSSGGQGGSGRSNSGQQGYSQSSGGKDDSGGPAGRSSDGIYV